MTDRDTITLPREVVELVLDALEFYWGGQPMGPKKREALAALRKALAAEQPSEDAEALRRDAERYRWMKQEVKRIPPSWGLIGWDAAIDAAMEGKT